MKRLPGDQAIPGIAVYTQGFKLRWTYRGRWDLRVCMDDVGIRV